MLLVLWLTVPALVGRSAFCHNIPVENLPVQGYDPLTYRVGITRGLQWENSWRLTAAPSCRDAARVFVRYRVDGGDGHHAELNGTPVMPAGFAPRSKELRLRRADDKQTNLYLSYILAFFLFFPGAASGVSSPPVAPFVTAPFFGGSGGGDHRTSTVMALSSLPAALQTFSVEAHGHGGLITWQARGESLTGHRVERSFDGKTFHPFYFPPITGNAPEKHLCTFIDSDPHVGGQASTARPASPGGRSPGHYVLR